MQKGTVKLTRAAMNCVNILKDDKNVEFLDVLQVNNCGDVIVCGSRSVVAIAAKHIGDPMRIRGALIRKVLKDNKDIREAVFVEHDDGSIVCNGEESTPVHLKVMPFAGIVDGFYKQTNGKLCIFDMRELKAFIALLDKVINDGSNTCDNVGVEIVDAGMVVHGIGASEGAGVEGQKIVAVLSKSGGKVGRSANNAGFMEVGENRDEFMGRLKRIEDETLMRKGMKLKVKVEVVENKGRAMMKKNLKGKKW